MSSSEMVISGGIDLSAFSRTLPTLPMHHVGRTSLASQVYEIARDNRVITIKGPGAMGKTVFLSEFVRQHRTRAISFFVGTDHWSSRPGYFLAQCCEQMKQLVPRFNNVEIECLNDRDIYDLFGRLYYAVARLGQKTPDRPFVFVVDSLDRVREDFGQDSILSLLPNDPLEGTCLVTSCIPDTALRFRHLAWPMPAFSFPESSQYLSDISAEKDSITRLIKASDGVPGYLAHIRKMIDQGVPVEDLIINPAKGLGELFERDWQRVCTDEFTCRVLAMLSFSDDSYSATSLSRILGSDPNTVRDSLSKSKFAELDPATDEVQFLTDSHKRFICEKLQPFKDEVISSLVQYYEKDPLSDEAQTHLPPLYYESKNRAKLSELLTPDYLSRSFESQTRLLSARRALRAFAHMVTEVGDWQSLAFVTVADAVLGEIFGGESPLESKLEALLAADNHDEALRLAYGSTLAEDRLVSTSRICKHLYREGLPISADVRESLEHMLQSIIDPAEARGKLFDAAANLFPIMPNFAIRVLELIAKEENTGKGHLMDVLLSNLIVTSYDSVPTGELHDQIKDESIRDFSRAASPLLSKLREEDMFREVEKISDTSAKLFLLRSWCKSNPSHPSISEAVSLALSLMIRSRDYTPSMCDLRQLAEPLSNCSDGETLSSILSDIELLKNTIVVNPADEKARLEIILSLIEQRRDPDAAIRRFWGIYFSLDGIDEPETRCFILAHLLLALPMIDPNDILLRDELLEKLDNSFHEVLLESAEQYRVTRRILVAVAKYDPNRALCFADELNMSHRRDSAREEILKTYVRTSLGLIDVNVIVRGLASFEEDSARELALARLLNYVSREEVIPSDLNWNRLVDIIEKTASPQLRASSCAFFLAGAGRNDSKNREPISARLLEAVVAVDDMGTRISLCFFLSGVVAHTDKDLSSRLFNLGCEEETRHDLTSPLLNHLYASACELAIRMVPDVCKGSGVSAVVSQITSLIGYSPSPIARAVLLGNLGLRLKAAKTTSHVDNAGESFGKVVSSCVTTLEQISDPDGRVHTVISCAPLLFEHSVGLLDAMLGDLSVQDRDRALSQIIRYLITKRPGIDPIDLDESRAHLEYPVALNACDVIGKMSTDQSIHAGVDTVTDKLMCRDRNDRLKCTLSESQALKVAKALASVIHTKLPDQKNIKHAGYKILSEACLTRLRDAASRRANPVWDSLCRPWTAVFVNRILSHCANPILSHPGTAS